MADGQIELLGAAEGQYADRKNRLGLALLRVSADLHLARFTTWVFECTHGGLSGHELVKSYQELASRPWGLCCSYGKARATVARALQLGLVCRTENRYVSMGQRANGYSIDWPGVGAVLDLSVRPGAGGRHPPVTSQHPPVTSQHPPVTSQQAYKDTVAFPDVSSGVALLPEPAPEEPGPEPLPADLLEQVPELAEAIHRKWNPLPVANLKRGVWSVLEEKHLASTIAIVDWWRRQLSLPEPVCGDTEAHLLLVLAAARYAARFPADQLTRNRCALFVGVVHRKTWRRVIRFIGVVRDGLDQYREYARSNGDDADPCRRTETQPALSDE